MSPISFFHLYSRQLVLYINKKTRIPQDMFDTNLFKIGTNSHGTLPKKRGEKISPSFSLDIPTSSFLL